MCLSDGRSKLRNPIHVNDDFPRKFAFSSALGCILLRLAPQYLLADTALQPLDHAAHALDSQPDRRQGRNLLSAHALPEIQPENRAVAFLVLPVQAPLQVAV